MDRVELRRKNLIPPAAMPYKTPLGGLNYDCGDFPRNMDMAVKLADVAGFAARRDESASSAASCAASPSSTRSSARPGRAQEFAEMRFDTSGGATLLMGTKNQGQGHETIFAQILIEKLGLEPDGHPLHRRRHRHGRVRHRHQRLALDRDRRHRHARSRPTR